MFRKFLPKNTDFFDYFEQHSALTIEAYRQFLALTKETADRDSIVSRIKDLEHEADDVTRRCIEELRKTFITPIDRYDIHALIKRMDEVVDAVHATAARIGLYEITEIKPEVGEMAELLFRAATELGHALKGLRNLKNAQAIGERCRVVHQLESDGDGILRKALGRLFKEEPDAVRVIKWKEIYERLEKAADRCDDVATIIEGVVIEAT